MIEEILDEVASIGRQLLALQGQQLRLLARYQEARARDGELAVRSVPDEIGLALHVSRGYAEGQLHLARDLTSRLPTTLEALESGRVDLAKARVLAKITAPLSVEDARAVEAKVLPGAETRVLGQVRASARYYRDKVDPWAAERRRQRARSERRVVFETLEDGAAELAMIGPGDRVYLAWLVIDTHARRLRAGGDKRTLEELRHDVLLDLVLGKHNSRVQVHTYLHVPATTLAGIDSDPGILAGYGPVTAEACRELASRDALWRRVFTDPITNTVKDVDRKTYRPPDGLTEYIQVRDGTCIAPGCLRTAHACHLDHTIDWADGGRTRHDNLGALCSRHHRLKHMSGWKVYQFRPGHFEWVSPVGQRHERHPEPILA